MESLSVIYAKERITKAVIIRLIYNVFLLWKCAESCSNTSDNLWRIFLTSNALLFILGFLAIDSLLTVMWIYMPRLYHLHILLHSVLGLIFNLLFLDDVMDFTGFREDYTLYIAPFMWAFGWVTFVMCSSGRKELKFAKLEQKIINDSQT